METIRETRKKAGPQGRNFGMEIKENRSKWSDSRVESMRQSSIMEPSFKKFVAGRGVGQIRKNRGAEANSLEP
jgi:hypothetical protein